MPVSFGPEDPRDLRFIKDVYKKMTGKKTYGIASNPSLERTVL